MVVEVVGWSILALSAFCAVVAALFAAAAWMWARPEQVRILQAAMAQLETSTASSLNQIRIIRQDALTDLEQANRERELAQDYNRRSAARDNRGRANTETGPPAATRQFGGHRFGQ